MEIKPKYNENRVGATVFEPVKASQKDWLVVKSTVCGGSHKTMKSWHIDDMDSRILAGKLLAHEVYSKLIWKDETNFVFKVKISYPPNFKRELFLVGVERFVYVIYQKRIPIAVQKRVRKWLMKNLAGLKPFSCTFGFTKYNKLWGILIDEYGIVYLTYETTDCDDVIKSVYNEWEWAE